MNKRRGRRRLITITFIHFNSCTSPSHLSPTYHYFPFLLFFNGLFLAALEEQWGVLVRKNKRWSSLSPHPHYHYNSGMFPATLPTIPLPFPFPFPSPSLPLRSSLSLLFSLFSSVFTVGCSSSQFDGIPPRSYHDPAPSGILLLPPSSLREKRRWRRREERGEKREERRPTTIYPYYLFQTAITTSLQIPMAHPSRPCQSHSSAFPP